MSVRIGPAGPAPEGRRLRRLPGRIRADVTGLRGNPPFARRIERAFAALPGIERAEASEATGRVLILYDERVIAERAVLALLWELETLQRRRTRRRRPGFGARTPRTPGSLLAQALQPVAAVGLAVGVTLKVAVRGSSPLAASERLNAASVSLAVTGGYPQIRGALQRSLGRRVPVDDLLEYTSLGIKGAREATLGLTAGAAEGLFGFLEQSGLRRAERFRRRFLRPHGKVRLHLRNGGEMEIPVSELQPGSTIRLEGPVDVPADGVIVEGAALVGEWVFTGRTLRTRKTVGEALYLGTRIQHGEVLVKVQATGQWTRLGRMLSVAARAPRRDGLPADAVRAILRAGRAGLIAGFATLVLTRSWRRALAVLAVMNPNTVQAPAIACAGAAAEVAASAGVQVLRRGALDVLRGVDVVILDKAAALAGEVPEVADVIAVGEESAELVLGLAASVLRHEAFPAATPVFERALEARAPLAPASDVRPVDAVGVRGRVGGDDVLIGSPSVLAANGVSVDVLQDALARVRANGDAPLCVAVGGRAVGVLALRERLHERAADAVRGLRRAGVGEIIAWGTDSTPATERLARAAGIDRVWAGLDADERRAVVRRLQRDGHVVAVVGGAADDLRAATRADLVVGIGGGRDGQRQGIVSRTAHLVLPPGRLDLLPGLISVSARMVSIRRENERLASAVSAAGGLAAFLGVLPFAVADDVNHYLMLLLLANARRLTLEHLNGAAPEPVAPPPQTLWHALAPSDVAHTLGTDLTLGLTDEEAARRLQRSGLNVLAEAPPPSFWELSARQMKTGMTALLGGAAAASALVGERFNAALIGAVVLLNGGLGAAQEYRAGRATAALRRYVAPTARCRRGGEERLVPATHLVPGDVIELQAGDIVPADARVIEGYEFEAEEAALTGEAFPVEKHPGAVPPGTDLADRASMVYMGSAVAHGRARAIVVATGMDTTIGHIAGLLGNGAANGPPGTPLQAKLAGMSRGLAGLAALGGLLFVAAGLARRLTLRELVMGGVSLATAAVPEGLPTIVTIALTAAVQRMSDRSLIVRRLGAVETLGRVTVVCCDKTGTLTQNRMTVQAIAGGTLDWNGEAPDAAAFRRPDVAQILTIGAVCNDAVIVDEASRMTLGGHTEGALVLAAADAGLDPAGLRAAYARVGEMPFSTERGFMAVVCRHPGQGLAVMVKGAPETVVEFCDRRLVDGRVEPLNEPGRTRALEVSDRMAYEAMRVLAMAYAPLEAVPDAAALAHPRGCILAGLVGMTDPLRPEVRPAVARCEAGGVRVVMATGDHRSTAVAIARQLGLGFAREGVLEGRDLDRMSDAQLAEAVPRTRVFARVTPEHKLRIITAMQARGEVVAMTGDGVNDAPAVKRADVGIAMGHSGTEVTREASAIILGDDSFVSIVRAIEEGRGVRRNLRRAIGFLLGGNMGETLFMLGATLAGGEVPLAPVHLLLVNLFTDALPVMALAAAPAPPDAFGSRPLGELFDADFQRGVVRRGIVTGLAATAIYAIARAWNPRDYRTMTFAGLVASQLVQAQNWRRGEPADAFFTGALGTSWAALGILTVLPILQRPLGIRMLGPFGWAAVLGVSIAADRVLGGPRGLSPPVRGLLPFSSRDG